MPRSSGPSGARLRSGAVSRSGRPPSPTRGAVAGTPLPEPAAAAERVARESYGRLLALLAAPTRDIPAAEDALADAFERALKTWATAGVPDNPEAWLLTVTRN